MHVEKQNLLFKYFSDTLAAIIQSAKRSGRYDQGILDVGMTQEDHVELVKTHTFLRKHATGKAKIELHVLQVERGMSWDQALEKDKVCHKIISFQFHFYNTCSRRCQELRMKGSG